jgi:tetratricopeptide (TPR) repeat protein
MIGKDVRQWSRMGKPRWLFASTLALALTLGLTPATGAAPGSASRQIERPVVPDSQGLIHACYGRYDRRELHLVPLGTKCRPSENPLSWSQSAAGLRIEFNGPTIESPRVAISTADEDESTDRGSDKDEDKDDGGSVPSWIVEILRWAAYLLASLLSVVGVALLVPSLALVPFGWSVRWLAGRWPWLRRTRFACWFGATLQIKPFDESALESKLGSVFAELTQVRVAGDQEAGGMNLYVETGGTSAGAALEDLREVPQARALALALSLFKLGLWRPRLVAGGSLTYADDRPGAVAVVVTLRRNSKLIDSAEFWPVEHQQPIMSATTSNRLLAILAGAWIEHRVVDETPGPVANEAFLSHDPRSWALLRAGSELTRIGYLKEGADYFERALAIDGKNVGALVDLAHVRRLEREFHGAVALAFSAIELIEPHREKRAHAAKATPETPAPEPENAGPKPKKYGPEPWKPNPAPVWYRAQIVLVTVHSEWAKEYDRRSAEATADGHTDEARKLADKAHERRAKAFTTAVEVACTAMTTKSWVEQQLSPEERERVAKARNTRFKRKIRERAAKRAREEGWEFDPDRAIELDGLLKTTFEPGALLLVASTCRHRDDMPPLETDREIRYSDEGGELEERVVAARNEAYEELGKDEDIEPFLLIKYIRTLPRKSPRVIYNVACYYSLAALRAPGDEARKKCVTIAAEYLRQSIMRSPPRERRGLLRYAKGDIDLEPLHKYRPDCLDELNDQVQGVPEHREAAEG